MPAQHGTGAKVKAVVVAHMVNRGVIVPEQIERVGVLLIVANLADRQIRVAGLKAIDKEIDVGVGGEIRQQLFAVVRDATRLRIEWAEVSKTHKAVGRKQ